MQLQYLFSQVSKPFKVALYAYSLSQMSHLKGILQLFSQNKTSINVLMFFTELYLY